MRSPPAAGALFRAKEALLSYEAVISEPANTLQEMIVVSQGNDIDSPVLSIFSARTTLCYLLLLLRRLSDDLFTVCSLRQVSG